MRGVPEVLILPGLYNSGPKNWQSVWERERRDCRRVLQADWETPRRADWVAVLEAAVTSARGPVVLAGHSLSCTLVGYWAREASPAALEKGRGALLVAPSDTEAPTYPAGPEGFSPMPLWRLPFPSVVVASSNDVYVTPARAAQFAAAWGSRLVEVGPLGHINSDSDLGAWPVGQALLEELLAS